MLVSMNGVLVIIVFVFNFVEFLVSEYYWGNTYTIILLGE
jgi:hypothetical protein